VGGMPVKRRKAKERRNQITPEILQLFRRCLEMQANEDSEIWEANGGRRREYLDAWLALQQSLGLPPWHISPCDIDGPKPAYLNNLCSGPTWEVARDLRNLMLKQLGRS
jgi:hypothetical protein